MSKKEAIKVIEEISAVVNKYIETTAKFVKKAKAK